MEDDPALSSMQLWAGRMRADAADALAYGCSGLIGIHWRTKTLQTTVSALAQAGWEVVTRDALHVTRNPEDVTRDALHVTRNPEDVTRDALHVTRNPEDVTRDALHVTRNPGDVADSMSRVTRHASRVTTLPHHASRVTTTQADSNFMRKPRDLPVADFYADWALAQFGPEVADSMAKMLTGLDGQEVSINAGGGKKTRLPRPGEWITGPGGVILDTLTWEQREADYAFVNRMASWRREVKGAGNLERFDYWLNFFRYHRAFGKFGCSLGETGRLLKQAEKAGPGESGAMMDQFVSQRIRLVEIINEALGYLVAYASTPGDLGTITNWEQQLIPFNVDGQAVRIEKVTGRPLPPEALPSTAALKTKKVMVPTVRTHIQKGESLPLKLILYGMEPSKAVLRLRLLGTYTENEVEFTRLDRGVFRAEIPAAMIPDDFEYYILVREKNSNEYLWPATAPKMWQTVVVSPAGMK
jgi:hypothetical protein